MKTAKELFSLDNRVAIVTGGRGLYGASISAGLCEMGAQVVIASRSGEKCEAYAAELRAAGYAAVGMSLDLNDDDSIKRFSAAVVELQDSVSTNLNGQILLSQAVWII